VNQKGNIMPYTPPTGKVSTTPKRRADKVVSDAALTAGSTAATKTTAGIVKQSALVANATDATTVIAQLNSLLTALKAAGIMSTT
jgi:hypothetical protein